MSGWLREIIDIVSLMVIPTLFVAVPVYGLCRKVRVYESFVTGAKEGWGIGVMIMPYLVTIMFAIQMFRASGAMEALAALVTPVFEPLGIDPELLPMMIARPLTGGGSIGVLADISEEHGSASLITKTAAVMFGSTETTFYVLAVYFGAVGIKKTRHAVGAGLIADISALLLAVYVCAWLLS